MRIMEVFVLVDSPATGKEFIQYREVEDVLGLPQNFLPDLRRKIRKVLDAPRVLTPRAMAAAAEAAFDVRTLLQAASERLEEREAEALLRGLGALDYLVQAPVKSPTLVQALKDLHRVLEEISSPIPPVWGEEEVA